ncbi:helix-turn-helix domain-containing protein [Halegenticoccus tardaugens]|uniref:helix-turn-helix domain-containing protein n=1 Tax=Halegenticoccus tardaugens TaxID=2071624 RepID=UPI00100B784D|nr:helix-turn-helix domain-containing protein [Halegenticoccus tardaugens]
MSLISVLSIAHPDLALIPTIKAHPDARIDAISHSTTDPETGMFFFVVSGVSDAVDDTLDRDHTVERWTLVDDAGGNRIYRIRHTMETKLISTKTIELGGILLEAVSNGQGWDVRLHLPDREALADLWAFCKREGYSFELHRMFRQDEWVSGVTAELTDEQRDALLLAYEEGYFEEPREASLEDLAERLDISPTAVGGRIRRGTHQLVRATLVRECT